MWKKAVSCTILIVLLLNVIVEGAGTTTDKAHLIAQKTILSENVAVQKDLVVQYNLFNVGTSAAIDVLLVDDSWPEHSFKRVIGLTTAKWDRIPSGGNVSHTVVLIPKVPSQVITEPAVVSYRETAKSNLVTGFSSDIGYLDIMSSTENFRRTAPHGREWVNFGLLALGPILVPFAVWVYIQLNLLFHIFLFSCSCYSWRYFQGKFGPTCRTNWTKLAKYGQANRTNKARLYYIFMTKTGCT